MKKRLDAQQKNVLHFVDRNNCYAIVILGVVIAALNLIVPISIQMLVNFIAFGKVFQPVLIISLLVLFILGLTGLLGIWQFSLLEAVQQKIMVLVSATLGQKLLALNPTAFSDHRGPELVNRFFEVSSYQKSFSKLLLYGSNLILQILFSLMLLLFYHPYLFLFDILVVFCATMSILLPYSKALKSALAECFEKHIIAAWLEEILINKILFKLERYPGFVLKKLDETLVRFLGYRNTHFNQQVKHLLGFYLLGALGSSILLGLGGYLVIINQLSLGQLVASEVVFGYLVYALKEAGPLLEEYYDFRAAIDKLNEVLALPTEYSDASLSEKRIKLDTLQLNVVPTPLSSNHTCVLKQSFALHNKQVNTLVSRSPDLCVEIGHLLLGFDAKINAYIAINNVPANQNVFFLLRKITSFVGSPSWFFGTLAENLSLNASDVSLEEMFVLLKQFDLERRIILLEQGIDTYLHDVAQYFTQSEQILLTIIRAILAKPKLIIIDRALDGLTPSESSIVLAVLKNLGISTILLSQSDRIAAQSTNVIRLDP